MLRFGEELTELTRERGLSWNELAARSKVSATYLKDLSYGRRGASFPSAGIVAAIASVLDVEPTWFLLERARVVLANPDAIDAAYTMLERGVLL